MGMRVTNGLSPVGVVESRLEVREACAWMARESTVNYGALYPRLDHATGLIRDNPDAALRELAGLENLLDTLQQKVRVCGGGKVEGTKRGNQSGQFYQPQCSPAPKPARAEGKKRAGDKSIRTKQINWDW